MTKWDWVLQGVIFVILIVFLVTGYVHSVWGWGGHTPASHAAIYAYLGGFAIAHLLFAGKRR